MRFLHFALLLTASTVLGAQSRNLDIYTIDAEGGGATLIVSPSGESMLIDTGYPVGDRDAKRIYAATQQAGLRKIDYVVISHYHPDHAGGLPALSKMIPLGQLFGRSTAELEPANQQWLDNFNNATAAKRTVVKAGDEIPLKGVRVTVVIADAKPIAKPVNGGGAANPLCADAEHQTPAGPENQRMVGVLLTFGKFRYLNLSDLDWEKELELVCPVNKLGAVTLYHVSRHGGLTGSGAPAFLGAIRPQVVVVNNGPRKGFGATDNSVKSVTPGGPRPYEKNSYLRLAGLPGIEGVWQMHLSLLDRDPAHNTAPDMIANFEETADCKGNGFKTSVQRDGKFTVTNSRNGFSKTYAAR
ncbi:MAG TPA: MBL fold metallo-hydrolase [Bryobacteraceae bacterium]|nr:MBL fold metallo-hydrolase [Bryobacteraceae bacterium]